MKKLPLLLLLLLIHPDVFGKSKTKPREVCVIGTHHNITNACNPRVLDSVLRIIKPDLIFVEMDSTFFTHDFYYDTIQRPYLIDPELSTVETITTYHYKKMNPEVDLRPYDISNRNDYYRQNDYFNIKPAMYQDIFKYASVDTVSERDYRDFMLLAVSLHCINNLNLSSLAALNAESTTSMTFLQNMIYMNSAINLTESIDSLKKYEDFAKWQKDFWETRNSRMIENIILLSEGYERTVVLTGNLHKYHLVLGLSANKLEIELKEFWEYYENAE